jgi:enoyl-CoA hydratase/carnithine racemase
MRRVGDADQDDEGGGNARNGREGARRLDSHARQLAKGPATAIQLAKKLVYRSANLPFDEHLDMAQMAMFIAQSTEDAREGPKAFVEKREPQFKGY